MSVTRNDAKMLSDITKAANALVRIADALDAIVAMKTVDNSVEKANGSPSYQKAREETIAINSEAWIAWCKANPLRKECDHNSTRHVVAHVVAENGDRTICNACGEVVVDA